MISFYVINATASYLFFILYCCQVKLDSYVQTTGQKTFQEPILAKMFNFSGLSDCSTSHIPPDGSLHVNKGKELIIIKNNNKTFSLRVKGCRENYLQERFYINTSIIEYSTILELRSVQPLTITVNIASYKPNHFPLYPIKKNRYTDIYLFHKDVAIFDRYTQHS